MPDFFIKRNEQLFGPVTPDQLKAGASNGKLKGSDHVAQSKEGPWIEAHKIPLLNFPNTTVLNELPAAEAVIDLESAAEYQLQEEQVPDDTIILNRLLRNCVEHEACLFEDGETFYFNNNLQIAVFETIEQDEDLATHRLTITALTGYTLEDVQGFLDPSDFLSHNFTTEGYGAWTITDERQLVVKHSFCINRFASPEYSFPELELTWLKVHLSHAQVRIAERKGLLFAQIGEHLTEQEQAERQEQHSDTAGAIGQLIGGIAKGLLGA